MNSRNNKQEQQEQEQGTVPLIRNASVHQWKSGTVGVTLAPCVYVYACVEPHARTHHVHQSVCMCVCVCVRSLFFMVIFLWSLPLCVFWWHLIFVFFVLGSVEQAWVGRGGRGGVNIELKVPISLTSFCFILVSLFHSHNLSFILVSLSLVSLLHSLTLCLILVRLFHCLTFCFIFHSLFHYLALSCILDLCKEFCWLV